MRGDPTEHATGGKPPHQLHIISVDIRLRRKRHIRRLLISPLAQPYPNPLPQQPLRILSSPIQIRLQHRPHRSRPLLMQPLGHRNRFLGIVRAFHIDSHKTADAGRMFHHLADDALRQLRPGAIAGAAPADGHAHLA